MPKRKLEECTSSDEGVECETSSEDSNSSVKTDSSTDVPTAQAAGNFTHIRKKQKKSVTFDGVTVFYFPRKQGFTCVPSQGGSSLGMGEKHEMVEEFSISEYTQMQRKLHRQILMEQHSQGKINMPLAKLYPEKNSVEPQNDNDSEDSEEDFTVDDYYFLQPVPTRQRRTLLRQSGVKKIDTSEKEDCKTIRTSREVCGCDCRVHCDPETCICSRAGIKCQVDRLSFPCGCSKDGCGNPHGRVEFNPIRVRTHFLHTVMRLEMEKKYGGENERRKSQTTTMLIQDNSLVENGPRIEGDSEDSKSLVSSLGDSKEEEDEGEDELTGFNSNERGSCCDCQKSEIPDILMQEAQYSSSASVESSVASQCPPFTALREEADMVLPNTAVRQQQPDHLQQVMIFNEEDEDYNAENTTGMYQFPKEESSYSESSDCSSESSASGEEHSFPTFQTLSSFDSDGSNHEAVSQATTAGSSNNYVIPPHHTSSTYIQSTAQPEQKYVELNGSTSYKLEPISEILNPIRFSGYGNAASQSWNGAYGGSQYSRSNDSTQNDVELCCSFTDNLNANITPLTTANSDFYVPPGVSAQTSPFSSLESFSNQASPCSSLDWNLAPTPICSPRMSEATPAVANQATSTTMTEIKCKKPHFSNQLEPLNHNESPDISLDNCLSHPDVSDLHSEPTPSEQSPAQNFGEIIKESIVETVSA